MKPFIFLISIFLFAGCQKQDQPRQFTEDSSQTPQAQQVLPQTQKPLDNPHAGLDMSRLSPDARANLEKMLAQGQDPHAGIDMSAFGGKDPHAGMDMAGMMGPAGGGDNAPSPLSWNLPKGFKLGPGKVMRLASFYLEKDPDAIDCYIVSLPGTAGGVEANLKRWMGQVGLEPSDENYNQLLGSSRSVKTQGGLEAKFYDLASLQRSPEVKSMIAAIIVTKGSTIFVKMTGTKAAVHQNQEAFFELLKSLAPKS